MDTQQPDWIYECLDNLKQWLWHFHQGNPVSGKLWQHHLRDWYHQKIRKHLDEELRQARLDEHRILAGLDETGRKQRYLELAAQEGRKA